MWLLSRKGTFLCVYDRFLCLGHSIPIDIYRIPHRHTGTPKSSIWLFQMMPRLDATLAPSLSKISIDYSIAPCYTWISIILIWSFSSSCRNRLTDDITATIHQYYIRSYRTMRLQYPRSYHKLIDDVTATAFPCSSMTDTWDVPWSSFWREIKDQRSASIIKNQEMKCAKLPRIPSLRTLRSLAGPRPESGPRTSKMY